MPPAGRCGQHYTEHDGYREIEARRQQDSLSRAGWLKIYFRVSILDLADIRGMMFQPSYIDKRRD
jgi:hypothetical protein